MSHLKFLIQETNSGNDSMNMASVRRSRDCCRYHMVCRRSVGGNVTMLATMSATISAYVMSRPALPE